MEREWRGVRLVMGNKGEVWGEKVLKRGNVKGYWEWEGWERREDVGDDEKEGGTGGEREREERGVVR